MNAKQTAAKVKAGKKKRVTFTLEAPAAKSVFVSGSFNEWCADAHELLKNRSGTWSKTISLAPGRYEYRFIVDGHWQNDPACPGLACNPYGSHNSVLVVDA